MKSTEEIICYIGSFAYLDHISVFSIALHPYNFCILSLPLNKIWLFLKVIGKSTVIISFVVPKSWRMECLCWFLCIFDVACGEVGDAFWAVMAVDNIKEV